VVRSVAIRESGPAGHYWRCPLRVPYVWVRGRMGYPHGASRSGTAAREIALLVIKFPGYVAPWILGYVAPPDHCSLAP
jgi:hypothetical protein